MLTIKNLNFGYRTNDLLFHDLNLNLKPNNIYGLLGKNGAGKTTLLKLICGLCFAHFGSCEVLGYESHKRNLNMLKEIFILPEEFHSPDLTAHEYQKLYAPFYEKFDHDLFQESLKIFNFPIKRALSALSHGQKKQFLIAFGIATNTKILLLDEPTNGLDIPSKSQFRKLIASIATEDKIIIISTHQVKDVENLIDPILILENGKIIFNQSMTEVAMRLTLQKTTHSPDENETLYVEKQLDGYRVLTQNKSKKPSKIDLETLFNAVITNSEKINKVF